MPIYIVFMYGAIYAWALTYIILKWAYKIMPFQENINDKLRERLKKN